MDTLHVALIFQPSRIHIAEEVHIVDTPSVMLYYGSQPVSASDNGRVYCFTLAQLQAAHQHICNLLLSGQRKWVDPAALHTVEADNLFLTVAMQLSTVDQHTMLCFVLAYCLTVDGAYCSALLNQVLGVSNDIFEFVYTHRLEPWAVSQYAEAIGLPVHKFNQLFQAHYGVSPKQWLIEQRLGHALYLLQNTALKIIEVALASGFTSPAYFSDSFRRHFQVSPRQIRMETGTLPVGI